MNCPDLKSVLVEFLDDRLSPDQSRDARAHLDSCPACRREADAHRTAWDLAGRIEEIEPEANFGLAVRRRIRRSRLARLFGSCAAAAALIVAFVAVRGPDPVAEPETALRLDAEERRLLEELAVDRTWELADNIELIRAYELLDGDGAVAPPEEDH